MDPLKRMRNRFSIGRRSSVDPVRHVADDSCLMATAEKRARSGIPRLTVPHGPKRRSSSCDRNGNVSKVGNDGTLATCCAAGLLFTPQNPVTPRVSLSTRKAIDCISQLSAKSHTGRKDQRAALDKNEQLRLSRHIASYLNRTGMVGDVLAGGQGKMLSVPIQSIDMKNMNRGVFLTLFNLLYKEIGSRRKMDLNAANYHEKILLTAKKLGYQGVIYKSHILAPNTPHSWPYVIAFLGWLVDLVESSRPVDAMIENEASSEVMALNEFCLKSYLAFINDETPGEPPEEYVEEFKKKLSIIWNVEPEVMEELRVRRNRIKGLVDAEQQCMDDLKDGIKKENEETKNLILEIENITKENSSWVTEKAEKMKKIAENVEKKEMLRAKLEQLKKEKESLKIVCSQQRLSKPEWDKMVAENKEIRRGCQMVAEMCEQAKKIVDNLDLKISSTRNRMNKLWFEVVESSVPIPADSTEVSRLLELIQNFNLLSPEAEQCFEELFSTLQNVLGEITSKVTRDEDKAKAMQDKMREIDVKTKELQNTNKKLRLELDTVTNNLQSLTKKLQGEKDKLSKEIQQVTLQVKFISESSVGDCNVELEKAKEELREQENKLEVRKQECASCLKEMEEMSASYLKVAMEKMSAFHAEFNELSKEIAKHTK